MSQNYSTDIGGGSSAGAGTALSSGAFQYITLATTLVLFIVFIFIATINMYSKCFGFSRPNYNSYYNSNGGAASNSNNSSTGFDKATIDQYLPSFTFKLSNQSLMSAQNSLNNQKDLQHSGIEQNGPVQYSGRCENKVYQNHPEPSGKCENRNDQNDLEHSGSGKFEQNDPEHSGPEKFDQNDLERSGADADLSNCCSICLGDFRDGDSCRVLSNCNHSFHVDCIDMWLYSHTTCPLCRSPAIIIPLRPNHHQVISVTAPAIADSVDDSNQLHRNTIPSAGLIADDHCLNVQNHDTVRTHIHHQSGSTHASSNTTISEFVTIDLR